MYKGLKRVFEGGLEPGLPRTLKVTNGEDIFVVEVIKQGLVTQCLLFGDTGNNNNNNNNNNNTLIEKDHLGDWSPEKDYCY